MAHEDNPWAQEAEENAARSQRSNVIGMTFKARADGEPVYVRILPAKKKGARPFMKYVVHWIPMRTSSKNKPIFHAIDKKCPLCKAVTKLWTEVHRLKEEEGKSDKDPEVKKIAQQIQSIKGKRTYDMNVIDRDDPVDDNGHVKIKRMVAGPTIWKHLLDLGNSKKWGNPSDPGERGYDVGVTVTGDGRNREYTIMPDPNRVALTDEELEALATKAYDLEKERPFTSPDDFADLIADARLPMSIDPKSFGSDDSQGDDDGDDDGDDAPPPSSRKAAPARSQDDDDDETPARPARQATAAAAPARQAATATKAAPKRQTELPPVEEDDVDGADPFSGRSSKTTRTAPAVDEMDDDGLDSSPEADKEQVDETPAPRRNRNLPF